MAFQLPVGSNSDVKELEYIASLHQTAKEVRANCSILDKDIKFFLLSRYGIKVSDEKVRDTILYGLGGGGGNTYDASVLDIMELTAILLIPILLKSADELDGVDLPPGVRAPPPNLIPRALEIILQDVTGHTTTTKKMPPMLTTGLLRQMFEAYGDVDIARNENLLLEMIECCGDGGGSCTTNSVRLDAKTFATALTFDVELYDIRSEVRMTTHKDDVLLTEGTGEPSDRLTKSDRELRLSSADYHERMASSQQVDSVQTLPSIDLTADTYRSKSLMVCLWACVLVTYFAYYWSELRTSSDEICREVGVQYDYNSPWLDNADAVGCDIAASIFMWLMTFLSLSIFGLVFVGLGSLGNDVNCRKWYWPVVGSLIVILATVIPFWSELRTTAGNTESGYLMFVSVILGLVVVAYHWMHVLSLTTPDAWLRNYPRFQKLLNPSTIRSESNGKHALAFKLNKLMQNALDIMNKGDGKAVINDSVVTTNFGRGLYFYSKFGRQWKTVGGLCWTWRHLRDKTLYREEGIWYSARLLASNICQYVVTVYVLWGGISLTKKVAEEYDQEAAHAQFNRLSQYVFANLVSEELVDSLMANFTMLVSDFAGGSGSDSLNCSAQGQEFLDQYCQSSTGGTLQCESDESINYLCGFVGGNGLDPQGQSDLLNASGFDSDLLLNISRTALQKAAIESVDSLYPSAKYMVVVPFIIGVIVAFVVALNLSLNYIPSVTATILKLRSGVIPLAGNPMLRRYRQAPETVALLTGSLFWSCLVASLVTGGVFGSVVFFFLWQCTAYFAQRFVAIFIGVLVISMLRLVIITGCRVNFYRALYRKRPGAANLGILVLEWASFALSSGFIFVRMVKLLLVAGFSIGRLDRPFLAPGVGQIGPLELDNYPTIFLRELVAHEAHRHPYLELLGTMYLTKLRYGKHFGKVAGSCWRLLFVYALMPWLHRYRVSTRAEVASVEMMSHQDFESEETPDASSLTLRRRSSAMSCYSGTSQILMEEARIAQTVSHADDELISGDSSTSLRRPSLMEEARIVEALNGVEEGVNQDEENTPQSSSEMRSDREMIEKLQRENAQLQAQLSKLQDKSQRLAV